MAIQELYTDQMSSGVAGISTNARQVNDQAKAKITILDNNKIPYDESIRNVDRNLHDQIELTNDTLEVVEQEYQKRIDVQGCRSDLFWRVVGLTTTLEDDGLGGETVSLEVSLRCEKLSPVYTIIPNPTPLTDDEDDFYPEGNVGFATNTMMWYTGNAGVGASLPGITTVTMTVRGDQLVSDGSAFDAYLEPDNLHGLKLYTEPYSRDVFDTFVATGIGTIAQGSTQLTLLTPNVNLGIETGMIVTPSSLQVFASSTGNVVVGVSSTTMDLSPYTDILGIGTETSTSVPVITLQDPAVANADAPNANGKYAFFDFSKDPATISDEMAVDTADNPYVPQVINIMGVDDYNKGVKIEYDNSGISSAPGEWNKFMEGLPDPDQLPDLVDVEEPKVGADKIYYRIGFGSKPVTIGGADASEGDTMVVTVDQFVTSPYVALPACNDTAVNNAISARNTAESALSGDNDFPKKVELVNKVRDKRNETNIAIWAYRSHIGDANAKVIGNDDFMNMVNTSPYKDLMNTGTEQELATMIPDHGFAWYDSEVSEIPMEDYDPNQYYLEEDSTEEYIESILVDINARSFCMFGSDGNERKVDSDSVEEFMVVLSLIRDVVDEEIIYYVEPLVDTENAR